VNTSTNERLSPAELHKLELDDKTLLLDVRSPAEFESVRIKGAVNVPLDVLEQRSTDVAARLCEITVLICQSGARASQAHQHLVGAGASPEALKVLEGGVSAFQVDAGADAVVKGKSRWALERQVRFLAGGIVFSSILASLRFPKARFLAGAVGGGLTYAGATDSCAMGKVLMRLPYNKAAGSPSVDEVLSRLPARRS